MQEYKFDIYAGLNGGFGGAYFQFTDEFSSEEAALECARQIAIDKYESYEGSHGIMSWEDCYEDLKDTFPDGCVDLEEVDYYYQKEVDAWIDYWIDPVITLIS
jgi:hypothetical protein